MTDPTSDPSLEPAVASAPPDAAATPPSPAAASTGLELDATSAAGRELLSRDQAPELVEGEVMQSDREWLNDNAGELINFLELVEPARDTFPDIKDIRADIAGMPDQAVTELANALRMYQAASAAIPPWLMKNIGKVARSIIRAQGVQLP